jgi:hypothetical protein
VKPIQFKRYKKWPIFSVGFHRPTLKMAHFGVGCHYTTDAKKLFMMSAVLV